MIRVVIADDHALMRSGFRYIVQAQPDMEVVGAAAEGLEAVRFTRALTLELIFLDGHPYAAGRRN